MILHNGKRFAWLIAGQVVTASLVLLIAVSCPRVHAASAGDDGREEKASNPIVVLTPGNDFVRNLDTAIEAVNQGRVDVLHFSPGEFRISKGMKLTKRAGQGGLRITGEGPGITKLIFSCKETAIHVEVDSDVRHSSKSPSFLLQNLSMIASDKCGTAVDFSLGNQSTSGGTAIKLFSNLTIEGEAGGSWAAGIKTTDLTFCSFRDVTLRLPREGAIGIFITGKTAPVDHHLSGIRILSAHTGIKVGGNVEGVYVDQTTMIGVDIGLDWDTTGHEPLLALSSSHISARTTCIRANNLLQPVITGNLLYQAGSDTTWTGIDVTTPRSTAYDLIQISNNTFHGNPKHTVPNTGISIQAASAGAINANVFSALDVGIRLGKETTDLKPSNSIFKNTAEEIVR